MQINITLDDVASCVRRIKAVSESLVTQQSISVFSDLGHSIAGANCIGQANRTSEYIVQQIGVLRNNLDLWTQTLSSVSSELQELDFQVDADLSSLAAGYCLADPLGAPPKNTEILEKSSVGQPINNFSTELKHRLGALDG